VSCVLLCFIYRVQQRIRSHYYRSLDDVEKDVLLLCKNAQTYNVEGSLVWYFTVVRHMLMMVLQYRGSYDAHICRLVAVAKTVVARVMSRCLQLLKIYWNLKTPLEILDISLNLMVVREIFVYDGITALVSSHKTGYQIAYLRNWSPYFIFATAPCCMKCISCFCSIFGQKTCTTRSGWLCGSDIIRMLWWKVLDMLH